MTTSRYLLARIAMAFGITRRQIRMADAAAETHLLREAEQILGERIWEKVEDVEELGIEYWNLRRLFSERDRLLKELKKSESILSGAHEQRASLLNEKSSGQEDLEEERLKLISNLEEFARERDAIVARAREVRRVYEGLKTKLEVLAEENREDAGVVRQTKERMNDLRGSFEELKAERDAVADRIKQFDDKLDSVDGRLEGERKKHREEASEAFQQIGDANRAISEIKAELGLIETRMHQLFAEIGRHVSRNAGTNHECRDASKGHTAMVEVMGALRKSINLNHRLAGL